MSLLKNPNPTNRIHQFLIKTTYQSFTILITLSKAVSTEETLSI